MKRIIGDLLSLITGNNDESYEPIRNEYIYFGIIVLLTIIMALTLLV